MRRALRILAASVPVPPAVGYLVAVAAVGLAVVPKVVFDPVLGRPVPFLLFFSTSLLSAWIGGRGPGLTATALSALAGVYFFVAPIRSLPAAGHALLQAGLFVVEGVAITLLTVSAQTALRRAGQRQQAARALAEVGRLLGESLERAVVVQRIVESVRTLSATMTTVLYEVQPDGQTLASLGAAGAGAVDLASGVAVPLDAGIVGLAIREGRAVASPDLFRDPRLIWTPDFRARVERAGHQAACAVPLVVKGQVIGVLGVADRAGRTFGPDDIALLEAFADHAGLALENARRFEREQAARAEAERARARATFLAEANQTLAASLDYEATLASIARLSVPAVGDWCVIDLVEEDGSFRRLPVAHANPDLASVAREIETRYALDPNQAAHPVLRVLRSGEPLLVSEIPPDDDTLARATRDAEHFRLVRLVSPKSVMIVPLAARGRVHGAISYAVTESDRRYGPEDLAMAEELARRAALAVDNARLHRDAEVAHRRALFLAEASGVLASSLDYETTLGAVARLAVPLLADWCIVDILGEDGVIQRLAVAHADPGQAGLARALREHGAPNLHAATGVAKALRTGQTQLIPEITEEHLAQATRDARHARIVRQAGMRSAMHVPLVARDRILGALTFVAAQSGRRYGPADLPGAEDLARRAALAVDNARLYADAQAANRLKDEFLATVSHELRTPLNAILGWTSVLRSGRLDEAQSRKAFETIERNVKAQAQIISDLLDVSRIITGKLPLDLQLVELAPVIQAAVEVIRPAAAAKELELSLQLSEGVGPVWADPGRLQQVVWNLLSNAVKFTEPRGRIEVVLDRDGGAARVQVRDTGQGIPARFLPHVFERFRQADSTSTRAHGGLGLGLAIVRHLVELHGGTVHAESAGEGQGATLMIRLPRQPVQLPLSVPDPARSPGLPESDRAVLDGLRVLVVDDDPDTRELAATVLRGHGCRVTAVDSAAAALQAVQQEPPDVVLADIAMPSEDGYTLIRKIRALPPERGGAVTAAAFTAHAGADDRVRALAAGFQLHLAKPVDPVSLASAVARLGRERRAN